jgi:hypothetical protein
LSIFFLSFPEINSTFQSSEQDNQQIEEDILYQRGASFSAKLDDSNTHNIKNNNNNNNNSNVNSTNDGDTKTKLKTSNNNKKIHKTENKISSENKLNIISDKSPNKTNKLVTGTSTTISRKNTITDNIKYTKLGLKSDTEKSINRHNRNKSIDSLDNIPSITTSTTTTNIPLADELQTSIDGYYSKEDVTVYDESISNINDNYNRNKLLIKDNIKDVNKPEMIHAKMINNNNDKKESVLNVLKQTNVNEKGVNITKEKSRTNNSDDSEKATM